MPKGLLLRHRTRRNRDVLAMKRERDAVTGPASRTACYRLQDQGQVVDLPVLEPLG